MSYTIRNGTPPTTTSKFKAGDVVFIISGNNKNIVAISLIKSVDEDDGYYDMVKMGLLENEIENDFIYTQGDIYSCGFVALENDAELLGHIDLSHSPLEANVNLTNNIKHLCKCPIFEMVNFGCKCGGV